MMICRKNLIFAILAIALPVQAQDRVKRVFGYDPVVLLRTGETVSGKANFSVTRYEFTYLFTDANSKAEFIRNPKKYELQFGGACGRMGPLSGIGNPNHFLVKDGKLFAFASAPCKQTFEKYSVKLLEFDEPKPKVSREAHELGKRLAEKILAAHGGREAILRLGAIEMVHSGSRIAGNRTYRFDSRFAFDLSKGMYADAETWDDYQYGNATNGEISAFISNHKSDFIMHPDQARALKRKAGRHLVSVLWSLAKRSALVYVNPDSPSSLNYWKDGVAMELGISVSGKIEAQEYVERGPESFMGKIRREYQEWQTYNGVSLPILWKGLFDGKATTESEKYSIKQLTILAAFAPPK